MQHPGLLALEQELKDCLRIAGQKTYRMGQEHPERDPERVWAWMLEDALEDFAYQWPMLLYCRGITEQFSKPHAPCHIHLEINRRWEDPIRQGDYYRVESGDTLWGIARRYGITLEELCAVNPGLQAEDPRKLAVNRQLVLPYGVPFKMRASLELLLPLHQQRMLEVYYHLGFLKKYSGIASLDLAYYREGCSPFGQDRVPLITPGWSDQTVWQQDAHPSQRPWTLAGTKVGHPLAYRFDSEGKGMKIGEPSHAPRLHLAEQNRWAKPPADGPVVAIDWLNLAPERMQDGWKETLAACRISLEVVYDAYEESLPYIRAVGRGLGSVLEGMAPIRPAKPDEPQTIPEALESIKDIPKNLANLPSQLKKVYEKGTPEQQIETTIVVGESLVGMLKGKPPKSKIAATAAGMGGNSKKVNKLAKVVNAAGDIFPGSPAHKLQRWEEYQIQGGKWDYDRWSKTYDNNMQRARVANQAVDDYHTEIDWGNREVTVDVDGQARRLDIADTDLMKGVEVKSGNYFSKTEDIMSEIARDKKLVERGWEIDWVIEGKASQPLLDELKNSGINVIQR